MTKAKPKPPAKDTTKSEGIQDPAGSGSGKKPAKPDTGDTRRVKASDLSPLKPGKPPGGTPKRGVPKRPGERGPDKQPRKPRIPQAPASGELQKPPAAEPFPVPGVPVDPELSELTAEGFVEIADVLCQSLLPPPLKADQKEKLIKIWRPIFALHADSWVASPWVPALTLTVGIFAPRIYARIWGQPTNPGTDPSGSYPGTTGDR